MDFGLLSDHLDLLLSVHDALGRTVATLIDGTRGPGSHVAYWDGTGSRVGPLPSGVYFVRLKVGNDIRVQKTVLAR